MSIDDLPPPNDKTMESAALFLLLAGADDARDEIRFELEPQDFYFDFYQKCFERLRNTDTTEAAMRRFIEFLQEYWSCNSNGAKPIKNPHQPRSHDWIRWELGAGSVIGHPASLVFALKCMKESRQLIHLCTETMRDCFHDEIPVAEIVSSHARSFKKIQGRERIYLSYSAEQKLTHLCDEEELVRRSLEMIENRQFRGKAVSDYQVIEVFASEKEALAGRSSWLKKLRGPEVASYDELELDGDWLLSAGFSPETEAFDANPEDEIPPHEITEFVITIPLENGETGDEPDVKVSSKKLRIQPVQPIPGHEDCTWNGIAWIEESEQLLSRYASVMIKYPETRGELKCLCRALGVKLFLK